jgi:hypothetical protein
MMDIIWILVGIIQVISLIFLIGVVILILSNP